MTRPVVRCRCGHRVLAKEVLRTDLYERPSGREYVYVKFRCKRCKRLGETFVAESRWDWRIFETARTEMTELESDTFAGQAPISAEEILEFHQRLQTIEAAGDLNSELDKALDKALESELASELLASELDSSDDSAPNTLPSTTLPSTPPDAVSKLRPDSRPDAKRDLKGDHKSEPKTKPSETAPGDDHLRRPPREG